MTQERIAEARCKIDMARLLTLKAAWLMDVAGNKVAKNEIAMIKVVAPNMACQVIDWAMQVHGGGGISDDFPLAYAYAGARTLRFADGPDEVHRNAIAKWELGKYGAYGRDAEAGRHARLDRELPVQSRRGADSQARVKISGACCSVPVRRRVLHAQVGLAAQQQDHERHFGRGRRGGPVHHQPRQLRARPRPAACSRRSVSTA